MKKFKTFFFSPQFNYTSNKLNIIRLLLTFKSHFNSNYILDIKVIILKLFCKVGDIV
jgi:hypothetical protein